MSLDIEDLMSKATQHALKIGADFAEVKGEDTKTMNIEAVNKEIRTVSEIRNIGIGVRVFCGKGSGFSFSSILDEQNVFYAVETAVKIAKASTKDSNETKTCRSQGYSREKNRRCEKAPKRGFT